MKTIKPGKEGILMFCGSRNATLLRTQLQTYNMSSRESKYFCTEHVHIKKFTEYLYLSLTVNPNIIVYQHAVAVGTLKLQILDSPV